MAKARRKKSKKDIDTQFKRIANAIAYNSDEYEKQLGHSSNAKEALEKAYERLAGYPDLSEKDKRLGRRAELLGEIAYRYEQNIARLQGGQRDNDAKYSQRQYMGLAVG